MSNAAERARFVEFKRITEADERDWTAFLDFQQAVSAAAQSAAIVNPYDDPRFVDEVAMLEAPIGQMFFRALARLSLGALIANAEGLGCAIRLGLVKAEGDALDGVGDDDALEELAGKGRQALEHHMAELGAERLRHKPEAD